MKIKKIKIVENGPYFVTGGIPLAEKWITSDGNKHKYKDGRELPQSETYALCRCGKSKNPPFCDGAHLHTRFDGEETASTALYTERAELLRGPGLDMLDDGRCAFARFCHRDNGDAWTLIRQSDNDENRSEAIIAANECPAGRLTAVTKTGQLCEPEYEPSIEILEDPEQNASCGIFVKGYIPIESSTGEEYEKRNRVVLCRCGKSRNKPFCDASHVDAGFRDWE